MFSLISRLKLITTVSTLLRYIGRLPLSNTKAFISLMGSCEQIYQTNSMNRKQTNYFNFHVYCILLSVVLQ